MNNEVSWIDPFDNGNEDEIIFSSSCVRQLDERDVVIPFGTGKNTEKGFDFSIGADVWEPFSWLFCLCESSKEHEQI